MNECCLTSTETRWPVRDGDEGGRGRKRSQDSRQAPARKTKDAVDRRQNSTILRQCPFGSAQQLLYQAIAVPTAMRNRATKTMSVAPPLGRRRR